MKKSVECYYSALLTQGRADNPTIGEAGRDLRRDWFAVVASGGIVRL